jgi:chromosomal replication initiation ATPase DnaA
MTIPLKTSYFVLPDLYQTKMRKEKEPDKVYRIIKFISSHMGIPHKDLIGESQEREIIYCRHMCMYIIRKRTPLSMERIAGVFNRMDHTTVKNAIRRIENYLETDPVKRAEIEKFLTVVY